MAIEQKDSNSGASIFVPTEEDKVALEKQKELYTSIEKSNLINTANWGLSLTGDNSAKLNQKISSLDSNKTYMLILDDIYPISSPVVINGKNLIITGKGGFKSLVAGITMLDIDNSPNICIQNISIDGDTKAYKGIDIENSEGFLFQNLLVKNFGTSAVNNIVGVYISVGNHHGRMIGCKVKNVIGSSVATGISVDNYRNTSSGTQYIVLDNCYIENVQPATDGDGFKILQINMNAHATIRNCRFINCAKRGIKAQSKYVYSENNYIQDSSGLAGIDFQMGYGRSVNDTIYITSTGLTPDEMIAISGDNVKIEGAILINESTRAVSEGIMINNVSGSASIDSVIIRNCLIRGVRYPFQFSGITSVGVLTIEGCRIEQFDGKYMFPTPLASISQFYFKNNVLDNSVLFALVPTTFPTTTRLFITGNYTPSDLLTGSLQRGNLILTDNIGQSWEETNSLRKHFVTAKPSTLTGSLGNMFLYAKKGDIAHNTNPTVLGTAGSQYIIKEWNCYADGDGTSNKGSWSEVRSITGT